jgi:glycosyltransferase involved in cell wall biosynthesis
MWGYRILIMKKNLVIISNDRFYNENNNFFCDHVAEKTLPDGLSKKFFTTVIGRGTSIKRSHNLEIKSVKTYKFLIFYLIEIVKKITERKSKFLILSISPYTFFASLLFLFSNQKPIIYLRSDGHQEYKSILGFFGPIIYSVMFNITSKISNFISCRNYILKDKKGKLVSPSELTSNWNLNTSKPNFEEVKLLYVGRVKVEKGIFSLLNLLKNNSKNITLTIVGESEQRKNTINQEKVNIYPIEKNKEKLIKYYDDNSIFILPSYTEGHPMVLLEALARRRPVIIFEEIKHVVGDKKGIFVAKRNSTSLLETINQIKENYNEIYEELKNNNLPTKNNFLKEFEDLILNFEK